MLATEFLGHGPRARQRVVDGRDFVVQNVRIGFIEVNSLFDDALIILVKRETAALVGAGAFHVAGLDLEYVVAAICVRIDPFANRIAHEGRIGMVGPTAPVGMDPTRHVVLEQDVGGLRREDEFHRKDDAHQPRHADWQASVPWVIAGSAQGLVSEARFEDRLILERQRGLLPATDGLGRIPLYAAGPEPLARPVGILGFVMRPRGGDRREDHRRQHDRTDRAPDWHVVLPFGDGRGDRIYCETRIGCPSFSLVLLTDQEPPGAPLRNGSIVSFSSSPGLSVLLDQPSRTNALGAPPSRLQSWMLPSCCLTARMMNECGLVNLNSCTTPSSSIGFSWSNIANE